MFRCDSVGPDWSLCALPLGHPGRHSDRCPVWAPWSHDPVDEGDRVVVRDGSEEANGSLGVVWKPLGEFILVVLENDVVWPVERRDQLERVWRDDG